MNGPNPANAASPIGEVTTAIENTAAHPPLPAPTKPPAVEPIGEIASAMAENEPLPATNPAEDYGQNPQTLRELGEIEEPKAPA